MMATDNKSLQRFLSNQTIRKIWARITESHPIQQSPSMRCPMEFAGGAFRNSTHQINEGRHQSELRLGVRGTLGTAPIIHVNLVAPSPQPGFIHHKQAVALSEHRQHHLHLTKMKRGLLPPATNRRAGVANTKVDGGST
jgi:hypothetical protein